MTPPSRLPSVDELCPMALEWREQLASRIRLTSDSGQQVERRPSANLAAPGPRFPARNDYDRVLVTASLPHVVRHWKADIWVAKPPYRRPDGQLLTDRGSRNLGQPMPQEATSREVNLASRAECAWPRSAPLGTPLKARQTAAATRSAEQPASVAACKTKACPWSPVDTGLRLFAGTCSNSTSVS